MLARLNRELDELLRRAYELAEWMRSTFEPAASRLSRQIENALQKRKLFPPPATAAAPLAPTYDLKRRMMP